jgi:hypothetical protein
MVAWEMESFRDVHLEIDRISSRLSGGVPDGALRADVEDVLTRGYVCALSGDARCRRLRKRLEGMGHRIEEPENATQVRRLTLELRTVEEATRALRARLAAMRSDLVGVGAAGRGSA